MDHVLLEWQSIDGGSETPRGRQRQRGGIDDGVACFGEDRSAVQRGGDDGQAGQEKDYSTHDVYFGGLPAATAGLLVSCGGGGTVMGASLDSSHTAMRKAPVA